VIKPIFILASLISMCCFAEQHPSNALQVQYQKSIKQNTETSNLFDLNLRSVYQIPETTYQYLNSVFTSFYQKLTFTTSIANSTFAKSSHYELVAIPFIPTNKKGFQLEVFGNFSDHFSQYLSNFSSDHLLYDYQSNSQELDITNCDLSLGAGISFNTSPRSKVKIIISNNDIPGYGTSKALLGFETQF